jgi:hypothetical protein
MCNRVCVCVCVCVCVSPSCELWCRGLLRDAESIPVDLWSHMKDIRAVLHKAKVRCCPSVA